MSLDSVSVSPSKEVESSVEKWVLSEYEIPELLQKSQKDYTILLKILCRGA